MRLTNLSYSFTTKAIACCALTLLSDVLFYGHTAGWTVGLFCAALLGILILHYPRGITGNLRQTLCVLLAGLCLSMVWQPTLLNVMLYVTGVIALTLMTKHLLPSSYVAALKTILRYALFGWRRFVIDMRKLYKVSKGPSIRHLHSNLLRHCLLPISLTAIFLILFSQANPVIDYWLGHIEWQYIEKLFSVWRIAFWLMSAALCWAVLRPRIQPSAPRTINASRANTAATLFNPASIFYSLLAFNGLFLLQNMLDLSVFLNGTVLPAGITYAQYAHQGAYPLITTALLAAAFVLITFQPRSEAAQWSTIRGLVYLWIGQNILLVFFSATRLYHYIGEYSLTYWRLYAFLWMGLVAAGLALIIARVYLQKSGAWLIRNNLLNALAVLYVCSFIPTGSIIAHFNVRHCREITGEGNILDISYLQIIGAQSLPAIQWYLKHAQPNASQAQGMLWSKGQLQSELSARNADWHSWTLRQAWLEHSYLQDEPMPDIPAGIYNSPWQYWGN